VGTKLILVHKWQFLNEVNRIPITCPFNILSSKFKKKFKTQIPKFTYMFVIWLLLQSIEVPPSDLQLPLQQWGAGNVYLLVSSKAKL
jgi:hypothetical protein